MGCGIIVTLSICPRKENAQDKRFQIWRLRTQETKIHNKILNIGQSVSHPFLIENPVPQICFHVFDTNETPKSLEAKEPG